MSLIRWRRGDDPFTAFTSLHDEMNRFLDRYQGTGEQREWAFQPPLDVTETGDGFEVTTELPGIEPDAVDISLTGQTLTVKGEKKNEKEEKDASYHRIERTYGAFTRSVTLPDSIDPEKVNASYDKGVLTVKIGKKEATLPRQIKISGK